MNWLDVAIIVAVAIPTIIGLGTGIIKTALSMAGMVLGVILAGRYYVLLSAQLTFLPSDGIAKIAAFVIILAGVVIVAIILSRLLERAVSMMLLGWVNRLGGAAFGLVLGAVLCSALLATWIKFLGPASAIVESNLAMILLDRFPLVLALLPGEFDSIRSFFQ
ncbi:hypothetical protein ES708_32390 [subsurface metagenome]